MLRFEKERNWGWKALSEANSIPYNKWTFAKLTNVEHSYHSRYGM